MRTLVRYLITLGLVVAGVAFAARGAEAQGILTSKHNLTYSGNTVKTTGTTEICVFCHTPHAADSAVKAPLWNRQVNTIATYTLYRSNDPSSTLDANVTSVDAGLGVSQACLSCHDGTIAFNALRNGPGSGNTTVTGFTYSTMAAVPDAIVNLGTDLRNDHPIAIAYVNSAGALQPRSPSSANEDEMAGFTNATQSAGGNFSAARWWVQRTVTNAGEDGLTNSTITLPLYNNDGYWRVQCGTCHDPHRAGGTNQELFLRSTNNHYSKLCRTCHRKDVNS